jgi:putative inorganic carbon (HCO3(-)) transporter
MTRERLTFGHGMHLPVPRPTAAAAATLAHEATPVKLSRVETWDWAWGGLLLFTILLFFRPQDQIQLLAQAHLNNVAALIGLTAMIGMKLSRGQPLTRLTPELIGVTALAFVAAITIPLSFWPGGAFNYFETYILPVVLIFALAINTVTSPRRVERITWVIVLAFGYMSARVCFDYMRGVNLLEGGRATGPVGGFFQNPNDLALNLASFVPFAFMYVKRPGPPLKRLVCLGISVVMLAAIIFTKSRGGTLGTLAMLITFLLIARVLSPIALIGLILAGMLILPAMPDNFWSRMASITDAKKDDTGSREERRILLQQGWTVFLESPLTGVGAGQFRNYWHRGLPKKWHEVHNVWLQLAAEIGIFGVIAFAFLVIRGFSAAWWTRKRLLFRRRGRGRRAERSDDEDGLTEDERSFLESHATAAVAAMVGWSVCALFASVAFNWTFYYVLLLCVTGRDVVRLRAAAYRKAKAAAQREAMAA